MLWAGGVENSRDSKSLTSPMSLIGTLHGDAAAVFEAEGAAGVNDLAAASDSPQTILGVGVADRRIPTSLEAMGDFAAVPAVLEIVDKVGLRGYGNDVRDCDGGGPGRQALAFAVGIEGIGKLGIFGRTRGIDDFEEGVRLRWRRLRIEGRDVEIEQIVRDDLVTAVVVPVPEIAPIRWRESVLVQIGPGDEMPAVVGGQIRCRRPCGWS